MGELGRYGQGLAYLEQSLDLWEKLNLQEGMEVHVHLAELALTRNQIERAEAECRLGS